MLYDFAETVRLQIQQLTFLGIVYDITQFFESLGQEIPIVESDCGCWILTDGIQFSD